MGVESSGRHLSSSDSSVYLIIHFPAPGIWHCKILLLLKGINVSSCSNKTSGLTPEKTKPREREERETKEPSQSIRGLRWDYIAISRFRLPSTSPRSLFIREVIYSLTTFWANIHRLLRCAHCQAGFCGSDSVSGSLGLAWPRKWQGLGMLGSRGAGDQAGRCTA